MDKQANANMICSALAEQDHPGVPEETKGKKAISTQHVKCIETLSRAQNASLLAAPPAKYETTNARTAENGGAVTPEYRKPHDGKPHLHAHA
jgi:hypothetical protein